MKAIAGQNVLTVLLAEPEEKEYFKMFFCPYTKNRTAQYQGQVKALLPGFDPLEYPQVAILPHRMDHGYNLHYTFKETSQKSPTIDFWIQDQYFMDAAIKTYFCFNCQSPQLYFAGNKAVHYESKADIKRGESYKCTNPLCKEKSTFTFLGIMKITEVL